jgi:two-component system sensor histidine kinase YesM
MTEERLEQISSRINNSDSAGQSDPSEMFGLSNVNERIKLKYGQRYGIHIDSTYGEGTKVTLLLPLS